MGMFDYLRVDFGESLAGGPQFQTKEFEVPYLEDYLISSSGRLIHKAVRYEEVPEEERPYFGKPGWDGFDKWIGSQRRVPIGDVDLNWHGYLHFHSYNDVSKEFFSYRAKFTDGQLQLIERLPE